MAQGQPTPNFSSPPYSSPLPTHPTNYFYYQSFPRLYNAVYHNNTMYVNNTHQMNNGYPPTDTELYPQYITNMAQKNQKMKSPIVKQILKRVKNITEESREDEKEEDVLKPVRIEIVQKQDKRAETRVEKHTQSQLKKHKAKNTKWLPMTNKPYSHPWQLNSFKGHTREVLDADFSSNGKYLATCSDDRTVLLFDVRNLNAKEHKSVRVNIDFDHPTFVKWSPDNKAFLIHRYQDGTIEVYKVEKKKDGSLGHATVAHTFPKVHEEEVIGMSISSNGKFIMTCSCKNDLVLWDLKGQVIAKIDTCLMTTFCAKISPCGKFVLASGFSPDAKVWEVSFGKGGEFQDAKRAFELTGHSSGIFDVACNTDSSQMVTVSKDGTWRLFDTKVEFRKGQDPYFMKSAKYNNPDEDPALVALSPNGVIVIAVKCNIQFYSASSGILDQSIDHVYEGKINRILFDATGYYLLTARHRHVLVFHNVTGYKSDIQNAKEKLNENQTSATRDRLLKIIKDGNAFLESIAK